MCIALKYGIWNTQAPEPGAVNALVSGGFLLLEHGWQQGEAVRQAFILAGYHDVETCRDYGDNERVTLGRYYQ